MDKKKKELIKNTIILFIGKTSTQFISFFLLPLYTSYLSTKEYGIVDLIQTYVTLFVPIISIQSGMSVFRFLVDSRGRDKDNKSNITNNFYIIFIALLIFSVIYSIVCLFVNFPYKLLIYFSVIVCTLSDDLLQVCRGMGKTIDYSIACIVTGVVTIVSNIVLICGFGYRETGMIFSMAFANFICCVYIFFRLRLYKYFSTKLKDTKLIKKMLSYSLPLVPNSISWWIVNVSDRTIVSWVIGTAANGIYAISNKLPTIMNALLGIFNLSWSESSALHINDKDREEFFSEIINSMIKLFGCVGLLLITLMPFVFPIFVNSKFNEALKYIPILVVAYVFNVVIVLYTGIYIGLKKTKEVAYVTIIGAIINIVVNICFIKQIGLFAAAISTAVAYFTMMMSRYFDLKKYMKITFNKKSILSLVFVFVIAFVAYYYNNLYINIVVAILSIIYAVVLNRKFAAETLKTIFKKFKY